MGDRHSKPIKGFAASGRIANPNVPMADIIGRVCGTLGVTFEKFFSNGRAMKTVVARELVVALAQKHTRLSFPEIARQMRRPNHSTTYAAISRWERRLEAARRGDQSALILIDGAAVDPKKVYEAIAADLERTAAA